MPEGFQNGTISGGARLFHVTGPGFVGVASGLQVDSKFKFNGSEPRRAQIIHSVQCLLVDSVSTTLGIVHSFLF